MDTKTKIELANEILQQYANAPKILKKDSGLIERKDLSNIILTEDNKELLRD